MNENRIRVSERHRRPPPRPDEVVSLAPRARSSAPTLATSSTPEPVSAALLGWSQHLREEIPHIPYEEMPALMETDSSEDLASQSTPSHPERTSFDSEHSMTALPSPANSSDDEAFEADARAYETDFRASQTTARDRRPASPVWLDTIESMGFYFD